jgi:hypothetical protein
MKTRMPSIVAVALLVGCTIYRTQAAPAPYRQLPSLTQLQRDVRRFGAPAVIARIEGNPLLPLQLCNQVSTATRDWVGLGVAQGWLEVVVALRDAADESLADCFEVALTDALAHEPSSVLAATRRSPNRGELLERVCRNPATRVSDRWRAPDWKDWTLSLLRDVPEALAAERDACLTALQKTEQ